jgi:hypothetical protein
LSSRGAVLAACARHPGVRLAPERENDKRLNCRCSVSWYFYTRGAGHVRRSSWWYMQKRLSKARAILSLVSLQRSGP